MHFKEHLPSASNLMNSNRSIGYSLKSAVADIIDNSLAAGATIINITTPTEERPCLAILDDGYGMDASELESAMRYGSCPITATRSASDLGRFGLGLKTASLSQCRRLVVISKKAGGTLCGAFWDLDRLETDVPWPLGILDEDDFSSVPLIDSLRNRPHGTLVLWENLDVLLGSLRGGKDLGSRLDELLAKLKKHLGLVFHRFIEGDHKHPAVRIVFNNSDIEARDPFLKERSSRPYDRDVYEINGQRIYVQPYILPHPGHITQSERALVGDLDRNQGFYIYRNRRLIIWGTWFHLKKKTRLSQLARVQVDIPSSPEIDRLWDLDVKKSNASIPECLRESLKNAVEKIQGFSADRRIRRGREQTTKIGIWTRRQLPDGGFRYLINENNPTISNYITQHPEIRPVLRLVAAALPVDQMFADIHRDCEIHGDTEAVDAIAEQLSQAGFVVDKNLVLQIKKAFS